MGGEPLMVETVPLADHRLDDGDGVGPPFLTACSYEHGLDICAALGPGRAKEPEQRRAILTGRPQWCTHCSFCGVLVVKPELCVLHDNGCPDVAPERTITLTDAADYIALQMKARGFEPVVSDGMFAALVEEWRGRPAFFMSRGGNLLAGIVLQRFGVFNARDDEDDDPF